jgi:hypothetical protein
VLKSACRDDTLTHGARSLAGRSVGNRRDWDGRHIDDQIDPVAKRTRDTAVVTRNVRRRAPTDAPFFAAKTARARVHRGNEDKSSRKDGGARGTRNRHATFFERLSHHLKDAAIELRHLIQKEDTVVRQRDLTRTRNRAAANERDIRDRVMRRPEGTPRQQT